MALETVATPTAGAGLSADGEETAGTRLWPLDPSRFCPRER
jgi:hypothetical protein